MTKTVKIILFLSLSLNVWLFYNETRKNRFYTFDHNEPEVNIQLERSKFLSLIKEKYPKSATKKYLFIHIWSPGDWDSMKEMPMLDTLIRPLRNDFFYVFVCKDKTDYAWRKLQEHTRKCKNFVYMNGQKNFVNSIFQEKGDLNKKPWAFFETPTSVIVDQKGTILHYKNYKFPMNLTKGKTFPTKQKAMQYSDSAEKANKRNWYRSIDSLLISIK
jgi:hypothetical protein